MGQFTKDIQQKNWIEEKKQQAKEHRNRTFWKNVKNLNTKKK